MDMLKTMLSRRSVRRYTAQPLSEAELQTILTAALSSASGKGIYPWELLTVESREMLEKLSHCRKGAAKMLEGAAAAVLVWGDIEKSDTWVEDCSIVMTNMQLAAKSLGLGSCWIQGRGREAENGDSTEGYIRSLFAVPQKLSLLAILSVGHPAEEPAPHEAEKLHWEKAHKESF